VLSLARTVSGYHCVGGFAINTVGTSQLETSTVDQTSFQTSTRVTTASKSVYSTSV
jgi:hypothetical protein